MHGLTGLALERTLSALALILERTAQWPETARPALDALFRRFEGRVESPAAHDTGAEAAPSATPMALPTGDVSSSRDLLDRARQMAAFLGDQPQGTTRLAYDRVRAISPIYLQDRPLSNEIEALRMEFSCPVLRRSLVAAAPMPEFDDFFALAL